MILPWRERPHDSFSQNDKQRVMRAEITDLRTALATIENETIERCAKVCDEQARIQQKDHGRKSGCREKEGALLCALAIRKLKKEG